MKTNIIYTMVVITILFTTSVISCKKETLPAEKSNNGFEPISQANRINSEASVTTKNIMYYSCGMTVNVFTPVINSPKLYSFAYMVNGQQKSFGIGSFGNITFTNPDKFTFEFAGYLDKYQTVKSWRLKRTDGKYLTTILNNGLEYRDKLTGSHEAEQIFLLSSIDNNQYKILLPKLTVCNVVAIWDDIDVGYRIAGFEYNSSKLTGRDPKIIMISAIPPIIK